MLVQPESDEVVVESAIGSRRGGDGVKLLIAKLFARIARGQLGPGRKISEPELAQELNTSRGLLREAIRWLEAIELVQRIPNVGPRVAVFEPRDIIEFYEAREAIEGMAARLAATNMTDEELAMLRAHLEGAREAGVASLVEMSEDGEIEPDFHALILRGSKNRRLAQMFQTQAYLQMNLWRQQHGWIARGNPNSRRDHFRILEALESRDPECAELLVRRHIRRLREECIERLAAESPGDKAVAAASAGDEISDARAAAEGRKPDKASVARRR